MKPGEPFLPLYFEEEDQDLWRVLASIPPENRSGVVKSALRQAFMGETAAESLNHETRNSVSSDRVNENSFNHDKTNHAHISHDNVNCDEQAHNNGQGSLENDVEFTLEGLFVPAASASAENQQEAVRSDAGPAAGPKDSLSPWDNLLYHIIGTEDDEAVIAAIQKSAL